MAIQTSGAITLSDIQTEFGGSNPVSLSEYYAGGSYVPSGTSGTNGAVPTSGEIAVSDFYGTQSGITITVTEGSGINNGLHTGYGFNTLYALNNAYAGYAYGSVSPTTYDGATIYSLVRLASKYNNDPTPGFYVVLSGNRAQNFFTSINVQGYGTLLSSNATRTVLTGSSLGTRTRWGWAGVQPSTWDGTGTRTVTFS
jgi:hypothetical protein